MARSISAYLRHATDVRTVRQIYAITTAITEDPQTSQRLKRSSAASTRKLEQVLKLPIASAPFLASIWRDFHALKTVLEAEEPKQDVALEFETPQILPSASRPRRSSHSGDPGETPKDWVMKADIKM